MLIVWILDRWRFEYKARLELQANVQEIERRLIETKNAFEDWKERSIITFKNTLAEKDEALRKKSEEFEQVNLLNV